MTFIKLILKTILYKPLFNALIFLIWLIPGHNVAWAIIILTIVIRIILLPPSLKAARQQKKLRDLQPKIQEIQEKYKDNKEKQAQAMMEFYKTHKVSPLGSCLPLLIQLPILIVLYYVFLNGLGFERFDLLYSFTPRPDVIKTIFLGIDLAKPERWILPVLAGGLQYIQSRQMMPPSKSNQKNDMSQMLSKQMLYIMPLFTVIIAGQFPAAMPLYWIVTTLFGIGQQWWVDRENPTKIESGEIEPQAKKENKTKKGGVEVTVRRKK